MSLGTSDLSKPGQSLGIMVIKNAMLGLGRDPVRDDQVWLGTRKTPLIGSI